MAFQTHTQTQTQTRNRDVAEHLTVLRAQLGEKDAFVALYERYQPRLLYYVRRLVGAGGGAEDVLQEVWIAVVKKIDGLEEPRAFRAWIYRIAHRRAISGLRRRRAEIPLSDLPDEPEDERDGHRLEELFGGFDAQTLHAGLERLSLAHREVLTLRFLEDLTYEEMAGVVGCGLGTIRSRIHYAKKKLYETLTGEPHE